MDLHCQTKGPESGPVVLFLHGFMGSGADWLPFAEALSDCRCLLPDLPGHGRTPFTEEHGLDRLAKDLLALAPPNRKVHLVGYSMGGRVVFTLLRLFPERIASAFIISASPGIADEAARLTRVESDERLAAHLEQESLEDFLDDWYALPLFQGLKKHPQAFAAMLERRRKNDPEQLANALRCYSQGRMVSCRQALTEISVPIHFEVGELDSKYVALAEEVRELCPNAEVHICDDCSHTIPVEDPKRLDHRLHDFLACR